MDQNRILELALQTLEKQKADIDAAIAEVQEFQDGIKRITSRNRRTPTIVVVKGRSRTPAERTAQAQRMREIWAKRRQAAKLATAPKTSPTASPKRKAKTAAEKKALSLKMKEIWKKRKAIAAKAK